MASTRAKPLKSGNDLQFGSELINATQSFILRKNVMAFIPLKVLAKGHVIVCPRRVLRRLSDLNEIETLELWCCSQEVVKVLEDMYKTECTLVVQDGTDAGPAVDHVHVHIIPAGSNPKLAFETIPSTFSETEIFEQASKLRQKFEAPPI